MNDQWIDVCAVGEIEAEDVLRFDHGAQTYAWVHRPAVAKNSLSAERNTA